MIDKEDYYMVHQEFFRELEVSTKFDCTIYDEVELHQYLEDALYWNLHNSFLELIYEH